jgi:hypothetical protein
MSDLAVSANVLVRLERLERENRRLRLSAAACGLCLFAWTACSVSKQVENQVSAERFVLLGEDGSEKAALEIAPRPGFFLRSCLGSARGRMDSNDRSE